MSRDTSTAVYRSTESSVSYANQLLQCDCHSPEYHQIKLMLDIGAKLFETGTRQSFVTL